MTVRQRDPRIHCPAFLVFVRTQRCCIPGCRTGAPVEAAHVRMGRPDIGKRSTGLSEKPHDFWAVPLCAEHHRTDKEAQHARGEAIWWAHHRLDPCAIARRLYRRYLKVGGKPGAPLARRQRAAKRPRPVRPPKAPRPAKTRRRAPKARQMPSRPFPKGRPFPPSRGFQR